MNPKIKTILHHGHKLVCKGKLILIDGREQKGDSLVLYGKGHYQPVIISETEEIEDWDTVLVNKSTTDIPDYHIEIFKVAVFIAGILEGRNEYIFKSGYSTTHLDACKKIIAMPENFSSQTLQDIIDGKLKDGDELFIRCENQYFEHQKYRDQNHCGNCAREWDNYLSKMKCREKEGEYQVMLWDNFVDVIAVNNISWTGVAFSIINSNIDITQFGQIMKFLRENYNPPTKKTNDKS